MGWRGTVRSLAAAARAADRAAQRRHKEYMRQQMYEASAEAVDAWEAYVADLISVHVDLADAIDWNSIASRQRPSSPERHRENEAKSLRELENFRPGMFDFLSGGPEKKKEKLRSKLNSSKAEDDRKFEQELESYKLQLVEWETDTSLARRLLRGDVEAMLEVIREFQSLSETDLIGKSVGFAVQDGVVHASPVVHGEDIVPSFRRKQLASGKLSETKMPIGQFYELYQDYVCSVALKVGGDLFHILPIDEVYVTCVTDMLDTTTGHQKPTPILSVKLVRDTFMRLNLGAIDPSDSMSNFNHAMSFKKTKGFSGVESLCPF